MTKTTTGSSRLTVILSWIIALACFVGGALFIWMMPSPDQGAIDLQAKNKSLRKASVKNKEGAVAKGASCQLFRATG